MKHVMIIVTVLFFAMHSATAFSANEVYFTTGLKIGKVTKSSAIVWVRLLKILWKKVWFLGQKTMYIAVQ